MDGKKRLGRPRLDPERRRGRKGAGGVQLSLSLNRAEVELLSAAAELAGQRPASYARKCILGFLHSGAAPVESSGSLNKKYAELARTAANINQLTHHINIFGSDSITPEISTHLIEMLVQLRDDLTQVRDIMRFGGQL